ncbi:MAG: hypothetical protein M3237_17735 [Actinomycetota bacterium]|nr:hypothetical protein [Actinomycetota bacterium]
MSTRAQTVMLAVLTASAVYVGAWAAPFPRSFYDSFPGLNRTWVAGDGPYNEHLVRDVGAFYLALAVVGVLALIWRERHVTLVVAAAWTTFSGPHLGYHAAHAGELDAFDAVAQVATLTGTLLLALLLLAGAARRTEEPR